MAADVPSFTLNTGAKIPSVGLGSWMGFPGGAERVYDMVTKALKAGYRHFDTAAGYSNEEEVGKAIKDFGIPRDQVFITTKLAMTSYGEVEQALNKSLKALLVDYVDLYLIHWPQAWDSKANMSNPVALQPDEHPTQPEVWKQLEAAFKAGKAKAIGVSNYSIKNLEKLLPSCEIIPAVNQVESHPCLPYNELNEYCKSKGILMTAYSSLGQGSGYKLLSEQPAVQAIVSRSNGEVTPGQVLLSWAVQRGTVVVPKSENEERLRQNITLIKLDDSDMDALNKVHKQPGMHRSLLGYHNDDETVFGWTYEQMGWNFTKGGIWKD